jgi:hypothetical protein
MDADDLYNKLHKLSIVIKKIHKIEFMILKIIAKSDRKIRKKVFKK